MTSFSPIFGLWEGIQLDPAIANAWGTPLSLNFTLAENAVGGTAIVNIGGLTTFTISKVNGGADNWKAAVIEFTGALASPCTVTIPNVPRGFGLVMNATTGGQNVTLTTGVGTTVIIPPGSALFLYSIDGSGNITLPSLGNGIAASSLTVSGATTLHALTAGATTLGATTAGPLILTGALTLPFQGNALKTTQNNAAIGFTTNGMVINLSNSGTANFQFQDLTQSYTWSFGASGVPMTLTGGGNLTITGTLTQASDRRLKENIETIDPSDGTAWVTRSRPVTYRIAGEQAAGFIAQEQIAAGFGDFYRLVENNELGADFDSPAGRQWVGDAISRIAYLTAALQDALARIERLEARGVP